MDSEQLEKINKLGGDVLRLSRNTLLVNLRFLDSALNALEPVQTDLITFATDGRFLLYDPAHLLRRYSKEKEATVRDYLHAVMHCVFRHMFVHTLVDQACWNLACDVAVEYAIRGLALPSAAVGREALQEEVFKKLEKENVMMTAEKLYRHFLDKKLIPEEIARLRGAFMADDHAIWYVTEEEKARIFGIGLMMTAGENGEDGENGESGEESEGSGKGRSEALQEGLSTLASALEGEWKDISEKMQMDLETFSKRQGSDPGGMLQNLREVNREKYDYSAFLKKFAVMHEAMTVNDDEFDYIFYTYGLKLYKKVPLVEPLEYKDVRRIREFVIAIDTSGSTSGELVQTFLQKTYNILMSTESFFSKVNIHIIQCDATIQEDAKITNQQEFDDYLKNMQIRGLGGTDFRPVFSYVDYLIERREFSNLKGLIYFTDGWGTFPEKKPGYETAFVFIRDDYFNPDIPPWAIKLVLQKEEV